MNLLPLGTVGSALLLIALIAPVSRADVRVELADGTSLVAGLVGFTPEKITIKTKSGEREIAMAEVVAVSGLSSARPLRSPLRIALADGSTLRARQCLVEGKSGQIEFAQGQPLETPSSAILSVRFRDPAPGTDPQWNELVAAEATSDRIILRREADGEQPELKAPGAAPSVSLDYREGTIVAVRPDVVEFDRDGKVLKVKRERLEGIIYLRRNLPDPVKLVGKLDDIDGNQWNVAKIGVAGDGVEIETAFGVKRAIPASQWRRFDLSEANAQYLSKLDGSISTALLFPLPGLTEAEQTIAGPRFDRSFDGPLRAGNTNFAHGLHAPVGTSAAYLTPEGHKTFRAIVAIDDRATPHGTIQLTIEGDGKTLFEQKLGPARRRPIPLAVDLQGAKRIRISITNASGGTSGGQLILAMARFTR